MIAKPLGSLSVSAEPSSPPTVENQTKTGVSLPIWFKKFALQNLLKSLVTVNLPWAPAPLAWTTLSGIHSLSKFAILSIKWVSYNKTGPYSPAV